MSEARERLSVAIENLKLAQVGPELLKGSFMNVAVYGAMVTFNTNNLSGKVDGFEAWDLENKQRYFDNPESKAMREVRNQMEKGAKNPIFSESRLHILNAETRKLLPPPPPNAETFFIGDRLGGSGWMVRMENGDEVPVYIDLPSEIGVSKPIIVLGDEHQDLFETATKYVDNLKGYMSSLENFLREREEQ